MGHGRHEVRLEPGDLGLWNLYGRLLNEGPWAALELKLDLLQQTPGSNDIWTSVHTKLEGGSFATADAGGGSLNSYRVTRMHVLAGNILELFVGCREIVKFQPTAIVVNE